MELLTICQEREEGWEFLHSVRGNVRKNGTSYSLQDGRREGGNFLQSVRGKERMGNFIQSVRVINRKIKLSKSVKGTERSFLRFVIGRRRKRRRRKRNFKGEEGCYSLQSLRRTVRMLGLLTVCKMKGEQGWDY